MTISIKSAKAKSRSLQNAVSEKLRELFPALDNTDIRPAIMGESGIDIKLSARAKEIIRYGIECKNQEKLNIWEAWKQAEGNAIKEKLFPALVFKRNRSNTLVVLSFDNFCVVLKENVDLKKELTRLKEEL